ncbi:MAG: hypothetical protein HY897_09470 [Deltaproteobacteria bacterium]|nr:hypothetical protein [Deltaproteobacteria bacterium]
MKARLDALVKTGEAARAVGLYELFIAGCYEKADAVHDECEFAMFVEDLFESWIKAREAAGTDPAETIKLLLGWVEKDQYGFASDLEKEAVAVFSRTGLAVYEATIRGLYETERSKAQAIAVAGKGADHQPYRLRQYGDVLKAIALRRGNINDYLKIAEEMGITPPDCEEIARLFKRRQRPEDALVWADRGIEMVKKLSRYDSVGYDLADFKRELLVKVGRSGDALQSVWAEFEEHPSAFTYRDLMKFAPKVEKQVWHEKAVALALQGPLDDAIELLVTAKEWERLAARVKAAKDVELEDISHFVLEPAAKGLAKDQPVLSGRLYQAQGMRTLVSKKSKYYNAALNNFRRAKECFVGAGQENLWQMIVDKVRTEHRLKSSFMPDFERLVAGKKPESDKSFLDRARQRWLK